MKHMMNQRNTRLLRTAAVLVGLLGVLTMSASAMHIAEGVKGKKLAIPMYILVSSHALQMAQRMGVADVLAEAGAEIIADSCPDQPCWHYLKGKVGITESPKCAYYPRRRGIHFIIRDLDTCIQAALTGEVK